MIEPEYCYTCKALVEDCTCKRDTTMTWCQGQFLDGPEYQNMPAAWKEQRREEEVFLVRPGPRENPICKTFSSKDAQWIASRLNLAARVSIVSPGSWNLEQAAFAAANSPDVPKWAQTTIKEMWRALCLVTPDGE